MEAPLVVQVGGRVAQPTRPDLRLGGLGFIRVHTCGTLPLYIYIYVVIGDLTYMYICVLYVYVAIGDRTYIYIYLYGTISCICTQTIPPPPPLSRVPTLTLGWVSFSGPLWDPPTGWRV
jgi:hypothetical protein